MQLEYNGTAIEAGGVWFTIARTEIRSGGRGRVSQRLGWKERWNVGGVLKRDSVADLTTAINDLETTLGTNGGDLIFYTDAGVTQSGHSLLSADTIDGTRVVAGPSFPKGLQGIWGMGDEYAGFKRSFQFSIEGEVYDPEGNLLSYYEAIRQLGSGGRKFKMVGSLEGQPQEQTLQAFTPVVVEQIGQAVGVHTTPNAQNPVYPGYLMNEPYLKGFATADQFGSVRDVGYPVSWRYVMEGPPGVVGLVHPQEPVIL